MTGVRTRVSQEDEVRGRRAMRRPRCQTRLRVSALPQTRNGGTSEEIVETVACASAHVTLRRMSEMEFLLLVRCRKVAA